MGQSLREKGWVVVDTWTTVFSEDNDCGFYCQHADAHYYTIGITNRLLNPTTIMAYVVQLHNGIYRFALNFLFIAAFCWKTQTNSLVFFLINCDCFQRLSRTIPRKDKKNSNRYLKTDNSCSTSIYWKCHYAI